MNYEGTYTVSASVGSCGVFQKPSPGSGDGTMNWIVSGSRGSGRFNWQEGGSNRKVDLSADEISPGVFEGEWPGTSGSVFGPAPFTVTIDGASLAVELDFTCEFGDPPETGNVSIQFDMTEIVVVDPPSPTPSPSPTPTPECTTASWNNPAGGSYSSAENWLDLETPAPESANTFGQLGTSIFTVNYSQNATAAALRHTGGDVVTLDLGGFSYTLTEAGNCGDSFIVGDDFNSELTITNGKVDAQTSTIADEAAHVAQVTVSQGGEFIARRDSTIGKAGDGLLVVEQGGKATGMSGVTLAESTGSKGTVRIQGAGSQLTVDGVLTVAQFGAGKFEVKEGATATAQSILAGILGGDPTILVSSANAALTVAGNTAIEGELGTLSVSGGANFTTGKLFLAQESDSVAIAGIDGQNTNVVVNESFSAAKEGSATVLVTGGASVDVAGTTSIGELNGSQGEVTIENSLTKWKNTGELNIGVAGQGKLFIKDGAVLESGDALISRSTTPVGGQFIPGKGDVTVEGGGSRWKSTGTLKIGIAGIGSLVIQDDSEVECSEADLGTSAEGEGNVFIRTRGDLFVTGRLRVGVDGIGTIAIDQSGSSLVANPIDVLSQSVMGSQTIYIGGAALAPKGSATHQDANIPTGGVITQELNLADAVLNVETLTLDDGGRLSGSATINGNFNMIGGLLEVEVGGLEDGQHGALAVSGTASISGGTVRFRFVDGFLPTMTNAVMFLDVAGGTAIENANFEFEGAAEGFQFQVNEVDGDLVFESLNDAQLGEGVIPGGVLEGELSSALPCAPGVACGPTTLGVLPWMILGLCWMKRSWCTRRSVV
jgi:T5SS/PEP-CTERM-associated repeat protein